MYLKDYAKNATSMYFHADRANPIVNFSTVNVNIYGDYFSVNVFGSINDSTSGIGEGKRVGELG